MRNQRIVRATLAALLVLALVPAASQAAGGATAEELVAKAQSTYDMQCATFGDAWSCGSWPLGVRFEPLSGAVTFLHATSDESADDGMSDVGRRMFEDLIPRGIDPYLLTTIPKGENWRKQAVPSSPRSSNPTVPSFGFIPPGISRVADRITAAETRLANNLEAPPDTREIRERPHHIFERRAEHATGGDRGKRICNIVRAGH